MPIKGLSDIRRLPRLGKIRLGIKVEHATKKGVTYPKPLTTSSAPQKSRRYIQGSPGSCG